MVLDDEFEKECIQTVFDEHKSTINRIVTFKMEKRDGNGSEDFRDDRNPEENRKQFQMRRMQPESNQAA